MMSLRWYVVHAYSNFEHRVADALKDRIKLHGMQEKFGEILVPTEEVVEMREGQKRKSDRKFFPGYVLVQMEMDEGTWHLVKEVPKVLGFIGGTPEKPAPISEKEAMGILRRVEEGVDKPKPKVLFEPGEVVRVIACMWRCRFSAARRRWSWISVRSKRPDPHLTNPMGSCVTRSVCTRRDTWPRKLLATSSCRSLQDRRIRAPRSVRRSVSRA
jgi:transcriptional antiterminator NusG